MITILVGLIIAAIVGILTGVLQWALAEFANIQLPTFDLGWEIPGMDWQLLNSVAPLAEMIAIVYACLGIFLIVNVIRWVKSLIPTVAN